MMKFAVSVAAALAVATPAAAQVTAEQVRPGMQVYHGTDQSVGIVTKVADGKATVRTGKYSVPLDPSSFALNRGKLYVSMTREALDTYYETKLLPAEESLAVGKPVLGLEGNTLGTIKEIDDSKVVIMLTSGQPIQLPRSGIVGAATGAKVGISASDVAKQLGSSAPTAGTGTDAK